MVDKKRLSIFSYPYNLVTVITIIASVFSLLHIGQKSLWLDEGYSILFGKVSWGDFWLITYYLELNQVLYHLLLRFWLVFGDSEFAVRSLSALFSVASVPVLYALASRLFGVRAGLISILLLSGNAFFVAYAQEARGYALVLFLVVLSSYLFVRVIEDPSDRRIFCGYICISTLAVYAHFFGALVLMAQALSVPFIPAGKLQLRKLVLANLLIAALLSPIVLFVLFKDVGQLSWVPKPTFSSLKSLAQDLAGNAGSWGNQVIMPLTAFYVFACLIALMDALLTVLKTGRSIDTWRYVLIISWVAVPICLTFSLSFWKPLLASRFLIVSLPGLVLLAGVGISIIRDNRCRILLLAFLVVLSFRTTLTEYYPKEKKQNFRDAVSYVVSHSERGDGISFYPAFMIVPFEYYWDHLNTRQVFLDAIYPWKFDQTISPPPARPLRFLSALAWRQDRYERFWVVESHDFGGSEATLRSILSVVENNFHLQVTKRYNGVRVLLFVRK